MLKSIVDFFALHTNFAMVALGFLVGTPAVWLYRGEKKTLETVLWCLVFMMGSVAAVLLFALFESYITGGNLSFGAVSTYGVYLFFAPVLYLLTRVFKGNSEEVFDSYALYALITLFFVRIVCITAGCCGGKEILNTGYHYATREAELLFYVLILYYFVKYRPAGSFLFLGMSYGAFRFICEFFRISVTPGLFHIAHLWSFVCVVVFGYLYKRRPD